MYPIAENFTSPNLLMTSQIAVKNCDGGHYCSPPKECCKQGCCYLLAPAVYRPPSLPAGNMFNPLFLGHWYFWAAITATVAGILCACSVWRRHSQTNLCCRNSGRDDRASEPDSTGSCYMPPHYSRCNSFHQAPPPYSEVTSKPDLYPLVISYNGYNGDNGQKNSRGSAGYLMVQYFRNYIVRPVGSLSATSTVESLNSSFICNATNEANTIIPPSYSCAGSLEEVSVANNSDSQFPHSISSMTCSDHQIGHHSPSNHSQSSGTNPTVGATKKVYQATNDQETRSTTSTGILMPNTLPASLERIRKPEQKGQYNCDVPPLISAPRINRKLASGVLAKDRSVDSESQEEEHNFSDLLNLSVCVPSSISHLPLTTLTSQSQDLQQSYSVVNSITGSDISSLANLGTPDSPPRATSPTLEIRELLDKIQQLPQQKSPVTEGVYRKKPYFTKGKVKTLYMPLNEGPSKYESTKISPNTTGKIFGVIGKGTRGWMSRSAPNTPSGNFVPNFPHAKRTFAGSQKGSKSKISDGSPLLNENEESDDEHKNGS